jgi:hypothetical protein
MNINGRTNIQGIDKKEVALTPKKADNETCAKLVFWAPIVDGSVKSRQLHLFVIPAKAGIQSSRCVMDAGASPA